MSRSGVYRAQAERAAREKAAETPEICTHCEHALADHGKYRCGVPASPGSLISCKCPIRGEKR